MSQRIPSSAKHFDLGDGSDLLYFEKFLDTKAGHTYLQNLDTELPWIKPTLTIFGRKCEQPRKTCYVASEGLPLYKYSGYEPVVNKWDSYSDLKSIADAVHKALPGCTFNSVLVNRYADGNDHVGWHADDEKLYGLIPTIASVTLGAEREFIIRRKKNKKGADVENAVASRLGSGNAFEILLGHSNKSKRKYPSDIHISNPVRDSYTFMLKHGSMLVMRGYTQRDWEHSVPKRKKVNGLRINLTFRYINPRE